MARVPDEEIERLKAEVSLERLVAAAGMAKDVAVGVITAKLGGL